jgi:NAD(P)-dependent dehydrogenase (short-subunit alcohol dehydrogenase family)
VPPSVSKALLITGAARGIGAACARLALERGWRVALVDRDEQALEREAEQLAVPAADVVTIACDVSDERQVRRAFAIASEHIGSPAALITSAGIDRGGLVHELDAATWDQVIAVNLRGTFLACREALRTMVTSGGSIVCISSPFAVVAAGGVAAYGSSKAGVCALVRSLAIDYASRGVRVNALLPGPTETELMWANVPPTEVASTREAVCGEVPLERLADPVEIAEPALWLLSDAAAYITGAQLACDGGLLAKAAISV